MMKLLVSILSVLTLAQALERETVRVIVRPLAPYQSPRWLACGGVSCSCRCDLFLTFAASLQIGHRNLKKDATMGYKGTKGKST
jgi:hypothetical protein